MISDILQPWQKEVLSQIHSNLRIIGMVARQSGKSFLGAYVAVEGAILDASSWICISTGERQSQEWLRKAINLAQYMHGMLRGSRMSFTYEHNASEIRFSTGGRIIAVPCNPDTLRGYSGNLICDECAFWQNDYDVWRAVAPILTSKFGGEKKVVVISTPGGKSGLFYDIWEKNLDFAKFKKTIHEVGKTEAEIEELRKNCIDEDIFQSEYECEFLDSNVSLFTYDLLNNSKWDVCPTGDTFLGIDIGRLHDLTSIAILVKHENRYFIKEVITLKEADFDNQFNKIINIIEALKVKKASIDSTGIGMQLAESLKKRLGGLIDPVMFTNASKNELFGNLKKEMSQGNLLIPDDRIVIDELHSIRRNVSSSGQLSYSAPRENGSHADRATSIALALRASSKTKTIFNPININI